MHNYGRENRIAWELKKIVGKRHCTMHEECFEVVINGNSNQKSHPIYAKLFYRKFDIHFS